MNFTIQKGRESDLIPAILAGDVRLYHQLVRIYERSVYFVSLSRLRNEEEAEDVAQETFIAAFRDLSAFRGRANFSVWLFGIALNLAGNRLRTKGINRIAARNEVQDELMPVPPALLSGWRRLGSESVGREEIRSLLRLAINELPEVYLQVTFFRDVEKLNLSDTAQILNITSSQVKATLHRSRMMLQRLLAPRLKAINK